MGNSPPSNRHSSRLAAYLLLHLRAGSNLLRSHRQLLPGSPHPAISRHKNSLRILRA